MSEPDDALAREAVRVYRRYAVEIVEALGFCPYAKRARLDGRTREVSVVSDPPTDEEVLCTIDELAGDVDVEIGLLLLPRLALDRRELGRWVEQLRKAHGKSSGGDPIFAIEGFHPDADADMSTPERLTPFVRRTPDPTLQLTRLTVLDRVRRGSPHGTEFFDPETMDLTELLEQPERLPLSDRILVQNHETVAHMGVATVRQRMDDILRDRDVAYATLDPRLPLRLRGDPSGGEAKTP